MTCNVPDDWDQYWFACPICGTWYHASEGGCSTCIPCEKCGKCFAPGDIEDGLCEGCFNDATEEIAEVEK